MKYLTPKVRKWMYGIAIAFIPLGAWLGWIDPEAVPLVVPLVVAILNVNEDPNEGHGQ